MIAQYKLVGISVYMAVLKASVRDMFARTKLYRTHDKNYMYLTVHDAVLSALNQHQEAKEEVRGARTEGMWAFDFQVLFEASASRVNRRRFAAVKSAFSFQ